MTDKERLRKFEKECCSKCKNKKSQECTIRIFTIDNITYTKCEEYERQDEL